MPAETYIEALQSDLVALREANAKLAEESRELEMSYEGLKQANTRLVEAATKLANAMDTCHICQCKVLVDETPIYCNDHGYDCQNHEEPPCEGIDVLHTSLRAALGGEKTDE